MVCIYLQSFGSVIWFQKYWLIKTKVLTHLKKKLSCIIRQYFINLWYTSKKNEQPKTKGKLHCKNLFHLQKQLWKEHNHHIITINITKLRISTHQWSIEKGRQCGVPRVLNVIYRRLKTNSSFCLCVQNITTELMETIPDINPNFSSLTPAEKLI